MSKTILITGATGRQGGSVIDSLLKQDADVEILAVTRDATSTRAQNLANKSPKIKLIQGNLDQPGEIFDNAKKATSSSVWGVFSVQPTWLFWDSDSEEKQGKGLVDTALENNVKHFVYTSADRGGDGASLDTPSPIPNTIGKYNIEHHLINRTEGTDMTWTILRPVCFLDGTLEPGLIGKLSATTFKVAVGGRRLPVIAVSDVGYFGAQAFMKPDAYKGKGISLAGDEISFDEMAKIFKSVTGKDVPTTFEFVSRLVMWIIPNFGAIARWFGDGRLKADVSALRKVHPGLKDFRSWLETESAWKR
ncbi:hypothetical protein BDW62DRAFT_203990 [Aspergillus aurantiobrunneus]